MRHIPVCDRRDVTFIATRDGGEQRVAPCHDNRERFERNQSVAGAVDIRGEPTSPAMLTTKTRLRLQGILRRLATGQPVTLNERIELQKHADRDPTVSAWLRRARRRQCQQPNGSDSDGLDNLLNQMDIGAHEPNSGFDPDQDDLGDWFGGAPSWLRRS